MKRLQGAEYHDVKGNLIPVSYSVTNSGNICVYYKGGFKHYLNEQEKKDFRPETLEEYKSSKRKPKFPSKLIYNN